MVYYKALSVKNSMLWCVNMVFELSQLTGFRKVDSDRWEFASESFLRGKRHLLKNIRRRTTLQQPQYSSQQQQQPFNIIPCVELGKFGLDDHELDRLKRDKQVLLVELVKLREEQQKTRAQIQELQQRIKKTETKQQQMMRFLARVIQSPSFVQQLIEQQNMRKEMEEALTIKRRKHIDQGPMISVGVGNVGNGFGLLDGIGEIFVKVEEPDRCDDVDEDNVDLEVSELDQLALHEEEEEEEEEYDPNKYVEEEFWKSMLDDFI
ncbi:hypothetical protein ACFE04_015744 [Oxalis oulophora]